MTLANWRDIAILIFVMEALFFSVLFLALTLVLAGIVRRADSALKDLLQSGQAYVSSLATNTDEITREQVVKPVARFHAAHAGARAFLRSLAKSAPFSQ